MPPKPLAVFAHEDEVAADFAADRRQAVAADIARYAPEQPAAQPTSAILLLTALAEHDGATYLHSLQVARRATVLAESLHFSTAELRLIFLAGLLHDIGMLTIRRSLLQKPTALSASEWTILRTHPEAGARIIQLYPELHALAPTILAHHERPDGLGYPNRLKLSEIPRTARVIAISEAIEAMQTRRPYAPAMQLDLLCGELRAGMGSLWDAELVRQALRLMQSQGPVWSFSLSIG